MKDWAANMKTELIFCLQTLTLTLQMSTFMDWLNLLYQHQLHFKNIFIRMPSSRHKWWQMRKGLSNFLTLMVPPGTTPIPLALLVRRRRRWRHWTCPGNDNKLLVVRVVAFVLATQSWFKKPKSHFHLISWIKHTSSFLWNDPLADVSLTFRERNSKHPWGTAAGAAVHRPAWEGALVRELCGNWPKRGPSSFQERATEGQTIVTHAWVFCGYFLEIEQSESVTTASDKIQVFNKNQNSGKSVFV